MIPKSLELARRQRSHLLFVQTGPAKGGDIAFERWFKEVFEPAMAADGRVLSSSRLRQASVDITKGRYPSVPFRYLSICELVLDGAAQAETLINEVSRLHVSSGVAAAPATWLYYPASEPAGDGDAQGGWLTVAYANPKPGHEAEFPEFYATGHIRHALNIPALARGQCFARAGYQKPGAWDASFELIALYEQVEPPEAIIEAFGTLPPGTIDFPAMDKSPGRFMETSYVRLD